ncbi:MAG: hypothetical protein Tsb009_21820 [Planctomycetaceae bacterium]
MIRFSLGAAFVILILSAQSTSAHYAWMTVDDTTGKANLYFEEGPAAGDGRYLDPFIKRGSMWYHTAKTTKAQKIKMTEVRDGKKRWLNANVPKTVPRSVDSSVIWGVYRYGKIDVLLHYYARHIAVKNRSEFAAVSSAPHLRFSVEPRFADGEMVFRLVFDGKPAVGKKVFIRGPGLRQTLTSDKKGEIRLSASKKGRYLLRAYHQIVGKSGEFEGKKYQQVRHHSSLIFTL